MNKVLLKMIADHMFNEETKDKIITKLNENVDIPIIGEGTEEKILEALYETIEAAMKEVLFKDEEVEAAE
jgi:imidazole glycerol phosphate synthase subunit HisF